MSRLEELDEGIQSKVQSAQANNAQLRYAATVSEDGQAISVGIIEADVVTNPLASLRGTGNMVSECITHPIGVKRNVIITVAPSALTRCWLTFFSLCKVAIHSEYYQTPLVVQGPGAGVEVTAAGVLSDIISLPH